MKLLEEFLVEVRSSSFELLKNINGSGSFGGIVERIPEDSAGVPWTNFNEIPFRNLSRKMIFL